MIKQVWIGLVLPIFLMQSAEVVVDRTVRPPEPASLAAPGMSAIGSSSKASVAPAINLPIRLDPLLAYISADGTLVISLRITNTGTIPIKIPLSFDQAKVHAPGALNRMQFAISIGIAKDGTPPSPRKRLAVAGLSSSDAFPDSYLELAPDASFILRVGAASKALDVHASDDIYVFAETTKLFDSKYFIEANSNLVTSAKPIKVATRPN